jgi:hypothetical protein
MPFVAASSNIDGSDHPALSRVYALPTLGNTFSLYSPKKGTPPHPYVDLLFFRLLEFHR